MLTVSALSGLNEQILEEIHMHVRGNAILPEKNGFQRLCRYDFTELTVAQKLQQLQIFHTSW